MMRTSGAITAVNQVSGSSAGRQLRLRQQWRRRRLQRLSARRRDMFIKAQVTSLNHGISRAERASGQWHQTRISLLESLPLKSITDTQHFSCLILTPSVAQCW